MLKNDNNGLIAFILILTLLFSLGATFASASESFGINSRAAALYEPTTKTFLYSKNSNVRLPMASTTKIMTALVAIERENLNKSVAVDPRAVGIEGSSAYLRAGETFTLRELLYALMLQSANDAAEAIAYNVAGSIADFANLMNEKAVNLGLSDTHFVNPHGLDDEEHYTSAHDLAIIAAEALESPEFCEIVSSKTKRIEKNGISRLFVNHNKLLSRYSGCIGVKTGFTKKSGRCLVGAAERDGLRLVTVTIDSSNDWNEHKQMFDYGFSILENKTLILKDDFKYSLPILNAKADSITLGITEDARAIIKRGNDRIKCEIELPRFVCAPIQAGDKVGKMLFKDGDKVLLSCDIVATESITAEKKKGFSLFK